MLFYAALRMDVLIHIYSMPHLIRGQPGVGVDAPLVRRGRFAYAPYDRSGAHTALMWNRITMTVTLNLPPEKEATFKAEAQARGLSLEEWMVEAAEQHV